MSLYFLYIAARHSNNFFHKLCLGIALSWPGSVTSVTLGYTFEKTKISGCSKKQKLPQLFFSLYFLYIAARHSNNFFHKLCLGIALSWPGSVTSVTLGYTFEKTKISGCSKKQKLPQLFFSPYFFIYSCSSFK